MKEHKATEVAEGIEEPPKMNKIYKITCGTFKTKKEALQKAAEARRAGVHVSLTICKTEYSLLYAKGITKAEAEAAKKAIEAKKVKVDITT